MADDKQPATTKLIDLAVEWVSPVLVMLMVGSLVFFLTEVGYRGEYPGRMLYTLFFFVAGCVLIARLSIQESRSYATLYALGLGFATCLAIVRWSIDHPVGLVGSLLLMPLIWWAADLLTWDCTHFEEGRKASGRGLLAAAGLDEAAGNEPEDDPAPEPKREPTTFLEKWEAYREQRRRKPHTPGVWVLYFALAALPVFALGQSLVDPADAARRRATFLDMAVYIGSALGLLVTTSLMGLRRYLEERGAKVPAALTLGWMGLGGGLILAFLVVGALLPRPHSETPWFGASRAGNREPSRSASKNAAVRDGSAGKGEGAAGTKTQKGDGKASAKGGEQKGGAAGEKGGGGGKGQSQGGGQKQQGKGGEKSDDPKGEKSEDQPDGKDDQPGRDDQRKGSQAKDDRQQSGDRQGQKGEQSRDATDDEQPPGEDTGPSAAERLGQALETVGSLVRWVVWAVIALAVVAAVVYFLVKGLAPFTDWARRLLDWWRSLFARKPAAGGGPAGEQEAAAVDRPPPFLDFRDPFADGSARRKPAAELVTYTFAALDSWAWDRDRGRKPGETPAEFAIRLGHEFEPLDEPGFKLADLYARVLYARGQLPADAKKSLAAVWEAFGAARPPRRPAQPV